MDRRSDAGVRPIRLPHENLVAGILAHHEHRALGAEELKERIEHGRHRRLESGARVRTAQDRGDRRGLSTELFFALSEIAGQDARQKKVRRAHDQPIGLELPLQHVRHQDEHHGFDHEQRHGGACCRERFRKSIHNRIELKIAPT